MEVLSRLKQAVDKYPRAIPVALVLAAGGAAVGAEEIQDRRAESALEEQVEVPSATQAYLRGESRQIKTAQAVTSFANYAQALCDRGNLDCTVSDIKNMGGKPRPDAGMLRVGFGRYEVLLFGKLVDGRVTNVDTIDFYDNRSLGQIFGGDVVYARLAADYGGAPLAAYATRTDDMPGYRFESRSADGQALEQEFSKILFRHQTALDLPIEQTVAEARAIDVRTQRFFVTMFDRVKRNGQY